MPYMKQFAACSTGIESLHSSNLKQVREMLWALCHLRHTIDLLTTRTVQPGGSLSNVLHVSFALATFAEWLAWTHCMIVSSQSTGTCHNTDTVTMTCCSVLEFFYTTTAVHHCLHLSASHSCKSSLHDCQSLQCSAIALTCMLTYMHTSWPDLEHMLLLVRWLPEQDLTQGAAQDCMYLTLGEESYFMNHWMT